MFCSACVGLCRNLKNLAPGGDTIFDTYWGHSRGIVFLYSCSAATAILVATTTTATTMDATASSILWPWLSVELKSTSCNANLSQGPWKLPDSCALLNFHAPYYNPCPELLHGAARRELDRLAAVAAVAASTGGPAEGSEKRALRLGIFDVEEGLGLIAFDGWNS